MHHKLKARIFQAPAIVLVVLSLLASFYIKITNSVPLSWVTPIILLLITVAYFYGRYLENKDMF